MADERYGVETPYDRPSSMPPSSTGYEPQWAATEGVLGKRLLAYLVDLVIIFGLLLLLGLVIAVLGVITLGLAL